MDKLYIKVEECENGYLISEEPNPRRHGGARYTARNVTELGFVVSQLARLARGEKCDDLTKHSKG